MNDRQASEHEVQAALAFWREFHTPGARRRVRMAIRYHRRWHEQDHYERAMTELEVRLAEQTLAWLDQDGGAF